MTDMNAEPTAMQTEAEEKTVKKNRLLAPAALLSISALMLAGCGDDNGDDEQPEDTETAAEETDDTEDEDTGDDDAGDEEAVEEEPEEDPADEEDDDAEEPSGDLLSLDEIESMLLDEDEFPTEFDYFEAGEDLTEGTGSMGVPTANQEISTCEELAELFQDAEGLQQELDDSAEEIEMTSGMNIGMWGMDAQNPDEMHMLQTGIISYEGAGDYTDYSLVQECEGEAFPMEDQGIEMEMTLYYLEHNGWEGVEIAMSMEAEGQSVEMDMSILSRIDGNNEVMVMSMGEGDEYLEEVADLQWDKYESAR